MWLLELPPDRVRQLPDDGLVSDQEFVEYRSRWSDLQAGDAPASQIREDEQGSRMGSYEPGGSAGGNERTRSGIGATTVLAVAAIGFANPALADDFNGTYTYAAGDSYTSSWKVTPCGPGCAHIESSSATPMLI